MNAFMPKPGDESVPLIFNVDAHVGPGSPNAPEDVMLVQLLIRLMGLRPLDAPANLTARMVKVSTTGTCDAFTIDAIKAVQEHMRKKNPGTVVDGRVSPAKGTVYGPGTAWTIVTLNASVRKRYPEIWPRLQDSTECPPALKVKVPTLI